MARIDLDQSGPSRYLRIAGDLRSQILAGRIPLGARLPTTRALARKLGVNRNTVVAAYAKLFEWGFARPHVGRGTFAVRPDEAPTEEARSGEARSGEARSGEARPGEAPGERARSASRSPAPWSGVFSRALEGRKVDSLAAIFSPGSARGVISFAGSFPAPDLLPVREFQRALHQALEKGRARPLSYGPAQGLLPLREWIAAEMTREGVPAQPEEILITNGSQQAIDIIARAFTDPGDTVLIENPTYSGAISSFQSYGARLAGLPLDGDGIVPETLDRVAGRSAAKLLYTIPSFQNPTTAVLPLSRRKLILARAAAADLLVIEDDWAGGLRFEGDGPASLRALDRDGRVIYMSTFAKKLIPALRIGWIAAARPIIERLTVLKQINDCCASPLLQAALFEFCRAGGLARHLPRVRAAYRIRRDRMITAMEGHFPARAVWSRPPGGLFLWVKLPEQIEAAAVAAEAESRGVLVTRGDPFYVDGSGPGCLRLTFASARPSEIERGIKIVGAILTKQLAAAGRRRPVPVREAVPLV